MTRTLLIAAALSAFSLAGCAQAQTPAQETPAAAATVPAAEFMATNGKKPGVVTLPSGLQYKVVASGPKTGVTPKPQDMIKVHYEGTLTNGEVFDSSYQAGAPMTARLGQLVPGWVEALQLMRKGDSWMLYLPPELGYGDRAAGPIPPGSVLVFKIELLDVLPQG
jgi:peptidylprolyl isomerase/FKBP-type peptidyl-prolyl cis-trans isomerase FklB